MSTRWCLLLLFCAGCGGGGVRDGRTDNAIVDACLHWTACVTPPAFATNLDLPFCASYWNGVLPWRNVGVAVTPAQVDCLAAAGLDCGAALDCVSAPSTAACDTPTWSCDGDTLSLCDAFAGARVVTQDCAAAGLHCITMGGEARCGLGTCDPTTATAACAGSVLTTCEPQTSYHGDKLGGLVIAGDDCSDHDATCSGGQCVGNGPACTFSGDTIGCDGNDVLTCGAGGHQERNHCPSGTTCGTSTGPGFTYVCVGSSGHVTECQEDPNFQLCDGNSLEYCDDKGNERLNCVALGYSGCDTGHCVP
jgi:hypothetical protein